MTDNNHLERIFDSLEELRDDISDVKGISIKNTVTLDEHARRSTASEDRLDLLEEHYTKLHVDALTRERMLTYALGVLGALGTIFGIIDAIHNFL